MKSTHWIKEKLKDVEKQLDDLDVQIRERGLNFDESLQKIHKYHYKNGKESELYINEHMSSLVGKKLILEEILKG